MKQISAVSFVLMAEMLLIKSCDYKCSGSSEHLRGPLTIVSWVWTMFFLLEETYWPQQRRRMSGSFWGDSCINSCCLWVRKWHKFPKSPSGTWPSYSIHLILSTMSGFGNQISLLTRAATPVKRIVHCIGHWNSYSGLREGVRVYLMIKLFCLKNPRHFPCWPTCLGI